ncbi:MAG: FtsX-like permease family protein [Acidimicrobiaceae bacterium]|nr:FtsX-like permease family protein [Acidimicrobiaceae bacterium]
MTGFFRTLRRQPAPLAGTFIALLLAAVVVTVTASLIGTAQTLSVPAQRLAATSVVITGNQKVAVTSDQDHHTSTDVVGLPAYRRLPISLARAAAAVPGVATAVPEVSIPLALQVAGGRVLSGSTAQPLTGYGWQSAPLTPFTIVSGHAPAASDQVVVGAGLARAAGLRPGDTVRLSGRDLPSFTVAGVAASPAGNPAQDQAVFFTNDEAAALYGHPGQADLIGVLARPDTSASVLAARIRDNPDFDGRTVLSGNRRGGAEDLAAAIDGFDLLQVAESAGFDVLLIALFVVAGTVSLSIAQRWRNIALMRAIGATPGQVRRMAMIELAILGGLAGLAGYLPGVWLASRAVRGMDAHQMLPATTHAWTNSWTSVWVVLITAGIGVVVAELAGLAAVRRASRLAPAAALAQANTQRRRPRLARLLAGLVMLAGGIALGVAALILPLSPSEQINLALVMLLALMTGVALLGTLLVAVAEGLLRQPVSVFSRAAGRLALADIRVRPQRTATAMVAIALAVMFTGAIYFIDATQNHAAVVEGGQRLTATAVVSAPGSGLGPAAVSAIAAEPGVGTAVGLTPTTVFVPYPGNDNTAAEAITGGSPAAVLNLKVSSGTLRGFGPGDIALSNIETGPTAVDTRVGQTLTAYLADGTPYRATVTAIYDRSLGFGDALIPAGAAGGGHLGSAAIGEVLVRPAPHTSLTALTQGLAPLAGRFPGLNVAGRGTVVNAQAELLTAQQSYGNNLLLGVIAALAGLALVNTLAMATVERRGSLRLLRRVGATTRQLLSMTWWQTVIVSAAGLVVGAAAAAATILVVTKTLTAAWTPTMSWTPVAIIAGTVIALTSVAIFTPTAWILAAHDEG